MTVFDEIKPTVKGHSVNGLGGVIFGIGVLDMSQEMNGVQIHSWITFVEYELFAKPAIIDSLKNYEGSDPIVLIGHSYGCPIIMDAARAVKKEIHLLFCVDGALMKPVPENVKTAVQIFPRFGRIGFPIRLAEGNSTTQVIERTLSGGHVSVASNPATKRLLMQQVLK